MSSRRGWRLPDMPSFATSADGTTIGYDRFGDGAPVILVGGAFQHRAIDPDTARMARALAAEGRTVVHYDRRGRGDSTDTAPYAVEREIEDLDALVRTHGGEAEAFGMSSGAILLLEAMRDGVAITRAAVYEAPLHVASAAEGDPDLIAHIEAACAAGRPGEAVDAFLGPIVGPEMLAGMRQAPIWPAFESVAPTLAYDCRIVERSVGAAGVVDLEHFAPVAQPLLVMAGERGDRFMRDAAEQLAAALPAAEHLVLPGQSHEVDVDVLGPVLGRWL